jgi:hypothetical protein
VTIKSTPLDITHSFPIMKMRLTAISRSSSRTPIWAVGGLVFQTYTQGLTNSFCLTTLQTCTAGNRWCKRFNNINDNALATEPGFSWCIFSSGRWGSPSIYMLKCLICCEDVQEWRANLKPSISPQLKHAIAKVKKS